jgi:hypothetical protein
LVAAAFACVLAALVVAAPVAAGEWLPAENALPADAPPVGEVPPDESSVPPPSRQEVAESETAFTDLSDTAALDLARDQFANVFHADLIPELDEQLDPDQEVDEYLDRYTARIIDAGADEVYQPSDGPNPNLLVESTIPMQAPEGGDLEPLDSDLEQVGDHFEADNPVVDSEISADLEEGVELPASDVTVAPAETAPTDPEPVADKVFYPNADTDSDYLIAPTATGAEIFLQLRSADSPESFPLDLDIPASATIETTPDGGAVVKDGGAGLVSVEPPRALDAADQEVAVHYAIAGDMLTVEVDHRDSGALYPIMVDPVVDQYNWGVENQGNPNPSPADWWWGTPYINHFNGFYATNEGGVRNRALGAAGGRHFDALEYSEWTNNSYRESSIERVDFFNFDNLPTSPGACTQLGIWNPDNWTWIGPNAVYDPQANNGGGGWTATNSIVQECGNGAHMTRNFIVGLTEQYDGPGGDPEAPVHSQAKFRLSNSYSGNRTADADNLLRSAYIYRGDTNNPWLTWNSASAGWQQAIAFDAHDAGLGVSYLWAVEPGTWNIKGTANIDCNGAHRAQCPADARMWANNLPEGRHDYVATALDPVLNGAAGMPFTAKIDRTGPDLALGGNLANYDNQPLPNGSYSLQITATDQTSTAGPAGERAGVAEYWVQVDGAQVAHEAPGCSTHSCPLQRNWTYNTAERSDSPHTVTVQVTDAAGNVSTDCLGVDRTTPITRTTEIEFNNLVPLSEIRNQLPPQTLASLVSADYEGPAVGNVVLGPLNVTQNIADFDSFYRSNHNSTSPLVRRIKIAGRSAVGALGSLATQVKSRLVKCELPNRGATAESEPAYPDLGDDDPDYERSTYPTKHWAPFKGSVRGSTLPNGLRWIRSTMRWASDDNLDDFDNFLFLPDDAYEHNLSLYETNFGNPCGHSWADKDAGFFDLEVDDDMKEANPHIDSDDNGNQCHAHGRFAFDLWLGAPTDLHGGVSYGYDLYISPGGASSSQFNLIPQLIEREHCPPGLGTTCGVVQEEGDRFVGNDRGHLPGCRRWRKGEPSKAC